MLRRRLSYTFGNNKDMPLIPIILIVVLVFWIDAERRRGIAARMITGVLLMATLVWFMQSASNLMEFYRNGRTIFVLENMAQAIDKDKRDPYIKMIQDYKKSYGDNVSELMEESKRLRLQLDESKDSNQRLQE